MMQSAIKALATIIPKPFNAKLEAVNCHHNYVEKEEHYGEEVMVTRKGAVSAKLGQYGIIPKFNGRQVLYCSWSWKSGVILFMFTWCRTSDEPC